MNAAAAFFYLFAGVTIASACMVVFSRNPVHSVLFLILAFDHHPDYRLGTGGAHQDAAGFAELGLKPSQRLRELGDVL